MSIPRRGEAPLPIACTLDGPQAMDGRLSEWRAVLDHARARRALPTGLRVEFDDQVPVAELARLVVAEQDCCRFFAFAITVDERGVGLEVAAPAEAREIVEGLFSG